MTNRDFENRGADAIGPNKPVVGNAPRLDPSSPVTEKRDLGDRIDDAWDRFRMRVREKWNDLTDDDLEEHRGKTREDLLGYVEERTGQRRVEIERDLDGFARDTGYRFK